MRRAAAALAVAAGLLALSPARASADDPHCIQHGTKHAYLCYYHQPGTGGGVYATLLLFENWYYWHPRSGDQVVDETYAKGSAPGFAPQNGHRTVHFSDGDEVADGTWLADFGHDKNPPRDCSEAANDGTVQACTGSERQSAMDFQHAVVTDRIPHSF